MALTQSDQLQKLKEQQKDLEKKILRIEHKQLLKIGKSAKTYELIG